MSYVSTNWMTVAIIFLIAALGAFVYRNSLSGPFLTDDYYTIVRNFPLRDLSNTREIVSQNLFASAGKATSSYFRPLTQLTFALDYQLWGLNPKGYRATNIAAHLINGALLFFLAQRWLSLMPAALVGLLFAVHPANVQAIAYISSRSDPLFVLFSILTVCLWVADKPTLRPMSWLFFLLALFSKEPAVVTPGLILLIDLASTRSLADAKAVLIRSWHGYLGFAAVFLVYLAIRVWLLGYPLLMEKEESFLSGGSGLLLAFKLLGKYLTLFFFPRDLAFEHTVSTPDGIMDDAVVAPVFLIALMGYLGVKLWHKERLLLIGLGWFLIGILPVLNLTPINLPMMESWLYLPEIGLIVFTVALGRLILPGKRLPVLASCLFLLLLSARTIVRSADWRDPIRLFQKNAALYPDAYLAWSGLSAAYREVNRHNDSLEALKKAQELRPGRWQLHLSLAMHHFNANEDDSAREELLAALRLKPDNAWAHYFLGILEFRSGRWLDALKDFQNALSGRPRIPMLDHLIGSTYAAMEKTAPAEAAFQKALQGTSANPQYHAGIHIELGRLLKERRDRRGARREFEVALRFHPESRRAAEELAALQK